MTGVPSGERITLFLADFVAQGGRDSNHESMEIRERGNMG